MKQLVQIELTNHCNRRCGYCGQINMRRPRGLMTMETFHACVRVLNKLGQKTVGLHHYGESTMHPNFLGFILETNKYGIKPWIYTNGDFLDYYIPDMARLQIHQLVISGHLPEEKRIQLSERAKSFGLNASYQGTVAKNATDLAGQINIPKRGPTEPLSDPENHCRFLKEEMCCVYWNGDLVPCCFDYDSKGVFGNINDLGSHLLAPKVNSLCAQCTGHPGNVV